jgi:hypothetical protein
MKKFVNEQKRDTATEIQEDLIDFVAAGHNKEEIKKVIEEHKEFQEVLEKEVPDLFDNLDDFLNDVTNAGIQKEDEALADLKGKIHRQDSKSVEEIKSSSGDVTTWGREKVEASTSQVEEESPDVAMRQEQRQEQRKLDLTIAEVEKDDVEL